MKRFISVLALLMMLLVVPAVVLGACGDRPLCPDCVTQETCEAKLLCEWDAVGEDCENVPVLSVGSGDITTLLANVSGLFTDAGLFIWVVIGLPLGFYVIKRVIALIPKK